jgi:hypothetical protein
MKKLILFAIVCLSFVQLSAQTKPASSTTQVQKDINKVLKFTNDNYNMGNIPYGKPTEFVVTIENISAAPVTLNNVQVSPSAIVEGEERGLGGGWGLKASAMYVQIDKTKFKHYFQDLVLNYWIMSQNTNIRF